MDRVRYRKTIAALSLLLGVSASGSAMAREEYRPSFHPDRLKGPPAGKPNEVLTLGSPHLSEFGETFRPEMLAPLIERLAGWRPAIIAIERVSGLQCDALRRYPSRYTSTLKSYCPDPTTAAKATGLDVPAANAEAERLLAAWPASPSPSQRRHLAAVFLAAGETPSALVQWLRLPAGEQREGDGLSADLVALLNRQKERRNEINLIAAPLAARLGHERLWSVDDHSADRPDPVDAKAYGEALQRAWDNPATKARLAEDKALQAGLAQPDGILKMYRAYNAPQAPLLAYQSDFGAALSEPSGQAFGRSYVGYWETRNLRMVANIRDVLGQHTGSRLLAIVGASHKGYYEAYLNQMHDVKLTDANSLLR
jgi:hypothetical protein